MTGASSCGNNGDVLISNLDGGNPLHLQTNGFEKKRIFWESMIKRLLDDLRVTAAKLLLLVLKVNTAGIKVTTAGRVYADREKNKDLSEKG
ncbi:hypothetical protein Tco_1516895 [Tanacetum coccineum]